MTPRASTVSLLLLGCLLSTQSQATSLVISTDLTLSLSMSSTKGTSNISSSFKDDKRVLAARSDAVAFVASDGVIRGAQLESALRHIRSVLREPYSDQQLARAILML